MRFCNLSDNELINFVINSDNELAKELFNRFEEKIEEQLSPKEDERNINWINTHIQCKLF